MDAALEFSWVVAEWTVAKVGSVGVSPLGVSTGKGESDVISGAGAIFGVVKDENQSSSIYRGLNDELDKIMGPKMDIRVGFSILVLCGKYNRPSVFAVDMCGFLPHNIIPEE
jgi:hypothetical protein